MEKMPEVKFAAGLQIGKEIILSYKYKNILVAPNGEFAIVEEETEKGTIQKIFLIPQRKFLSRKKYLDINFFQTSSGKRTDFVCAQKQNSKWAILNPYTGEEIEIFSNHPTPTEKPEIFVIHEDGKGDYFKNVITHEKTSDYFNGGVHQREDKNLFTVVIIEDETAKHGIFDIEKGLSVLSPKYKAGENGITICKYGKIAIVSEVRSNVSKLVTLYTERVLKEAENMIFYYGYGGYNTGIKQVGLNMSGNIEPINLHLI